MTTLLTATFRSFHQGVVVTLSLRQDADGYFVRCQPAGYAVRPNYDTRCGSITEAEAVFSQKYNIGMVGAP